MCRQNALQHREAYGQDSIVKSSRRRRIKITVPKSRKTANVLGRSCEHRIKEIRRSSKNLIFPAWETYFYLRTYYFTLPRGACK